MGGRTGTSAAVKRMVFAAMQTLAGYRHVTGRRTKCASGKTRVCQVGEATTKIRNLMPSSGFGKAA